MGMRSPLTQFFPLWCGLNGWMARWLAINGFLSIQSIDLIVIMFPNDYIASPWQSAMCRCSDISTKLQFFKFFFCEVPYRTFCNLSILSLFLLIFLAFFPVSFVSVCLFPFRFLYSLNIVSSCCCNSFLGFRGSISSLFGISNSVLCWYSNVIATSKSRSLVLNSFDLFSCSSIKCAIHLVMKSFNSCFFCSKTSSSLFHLT
jgi:hypothetical protein